MHGGNAEHAIGTRNKSFKHGRYSKYLPAQMVELFREAMDNPDLIEMGEHIALLDARIKSVLAESSSGDPAPHWSEISEAFEQVEVAILSGKIDEIVPGLEAMHKLLEAGVKWDRTWHDVMGTMEQLRKMTDTEVKRKKELNQMVPIERVTILMAAVGDAVKRHVTSPEEIDAVYAELAELMGGDRKRNGHSLVPPGPIINVTPEKKKRKLTTPKPLIVDVQTEA